ncbi:MAG TPA: aminoglycoside 6'-N-acetyltransferase, partial [Burkholderiales bacterium]
VMIERCTSVEQLGWLELRQALWTDCPPEQQLLEMAEHVAIPQRFADFVAYSDWGKPIGLAEAAMRTDYVNGATSTPVAFLEGIYVLPEARRQGVAASLVDAVCRWARECGCCELASDALLENPLSHAVHRALGFEETERVVFFRKPLAR